jgi:hypothetical protein
METAKINIKTTCLDYGNVNGLYGDEIRQLKQTEKSLTCRSIINHRYPKSE